MKRSAELFFNELARLLIQTEVTDREGKSLPLDEGCGRAVDLIMKSHAKGGKVMVTGNGGSAAIASHFHNDLCKAVGVRCLIFNESPLLTALANDNGYGCVFERPVEMWAEEDDILVAISSSGRSENILRPAKAAMIRGCQVLTFSGFKRDNPLRETGSLNFYTASESYGHVETAHSALTHYISDLAMAEKSGSVI
jgi:D-sedoheptulose 7-phosphate isomerase